MPQPDSLPQPEAIGALLTDLVGRTAACAKASGPVPPGPRVAGTYVRESGELGGVCVMDLKLAASLAAAMTMMPAGVTETSVRARQLDAALLDNAREVLNVCSRWLCLPSGYRVILADVHNGSIPPALAARFRKPSLSLEVNVSLEGYQGGRLSLYAF